MRKVLIKKIDVISIAKPLFFVMILVTLIMGFFISLFMLPAGLSSSGSSAVVVTGNAMSMWGPVFGMLAGVFCYMMCIYITLLIGLAIFNMFCRYTGGIKLEIEDLVE